MSDRAAGNSAPRTIVKGARRPRARSQPKSRRRPVSVAAVRRRGSACRRGRKYGRVSWSTKPDAKATAGSASVQFQSGRAAEMAKVPSRLVMAVGVAKWWRLAGGSPGAVRAVPPASGAVPPSPSSLSVVQPGSRTTLITGRSPGDQSRCASAGLAMVSAVRPARSARLFRFGVAVGAVVI